MNRFLANLLLLASVNLCTPLIRPASRFNASSDLDIFMSVIGRDAYRDVNYETITNLLTQRSAAQRLAIVKEYNTRYKREIFRVINFNILGNYNDLMVVMLTPIAKTYAEELYRDTEWDRVDSKAILEVITTFSNAEIKAVNEAVKQEYEGYDIENLAGYSKQLVHTFVSGALKGLRNETQEVDEIAARADAKVIHDIGEGLPGRTPTIGQLKKVEDIFIKRSHRQLRKICQEYEKLYSHGIQEAFAPGVWPPEYERSFLNMINVFKSIPDYYARRLDDSLNFFSNTNRVLNRIIVGRSEIDLDEIKGDFLYRTGQRLASMIEEHTSDQYQLALLAIVNS